jgi:hypothetical protein
MKSIQVIDAATAIYELFESTEAEFALIFPAETDISFSDEMSSRGNQADLTIALAKIWERRIAKKDLQRIDGVLVLAVGFI